MIKKIESPEKSVWLLTQSFQSFSQSVVISAAASEIIGDTINQFREANDVDEDLVDKTKITEADLLNLVNICHVLLESEPDDFDDMEDIE